MDCEARTEELMEGAPAQAASPTSSCICRHFSRCEVGAMVWILLPSRSALRGLMGVATLTQGKVNVAKEHSTRTNGAQSSTTVRLGDRARGDVPRSPGRMYLQRSTPHKAPLLSLTPNATVATTSILTAPRDPRSLAQSGAGHGASIRNPDTGHADHHVVGHGCGSSDCKCCERESRTCCQRGERGSREPCTPRYHYGGVAGQAYRTCVCNR